MGVRSSRRAGVMIFRASKRGQSHGKGGRLAEPHCGQAQKGLEESLTIRELAAPKETVCPRRSVGANLHHGPICFPALSAKLH